jgi:hypothetical protein
MVYLFRITTGSIYSYDSMECVDDKMILTSHNAQCIIKDIERITDNTFKGKFRGLSIQGIPCIISTDLDEFKKYATEEYEYKCQKEIEDINYVKRYILNDIKDIPKREE